MPETSSKQRWQLLKEQIESLKISANSSIFSFLCIPHDISFDKVLLANIKAFAKFLDEKAKNDEAKLLIMKGALCYFYGKKNNWQNVVLQSPFVSAISPLVQINEADKVKSLDHFLSFLHSFEEEIVSRSDDRFKYLFGLEIILEIEAYIRAQYEQAESESMADKLWKYSPFS